MVLSEGCGREVGVGVGPISLGCPRIKLETVLAQLPRRSLSVDVSGLLDHSHATDFYVLRQVVACVL
jgi:hypothetical protein